MRRAFGRCIHVPKALRTSCPPVYAPMSPNTPVPLSTSLPQGDRMCNGTQGRKPPLSDPQLFEAQFQELVSEVTEKDISDGALDDALSRLRQVRPGLALPGGFELL